ncbi:MAG: ATP-binding protein [Verrucomicrobia bacterium]|nr:ATP-binding protein [Verrucomicrobiota bacterium]MDA1068258.1 ATP-binding protein [Verrucomicrobiota bacterium]
MIQRVAEKKIREYAKQYPIVTITGPRQSGKTTLARHIFKNKAYVSLEDIDNRRVAREDPRGFLNTYKDGAILDEAQHAPDLFSYLQTDVDENSQPGRFIITGSQQFEMMEEVSQSLAGRTAIARLLPLALGEVSKSTSFSSFEEAIYTGFYPAIYDKHLNPTDVYSFYVSTYLERDVRRILNVVDMDRFDVFLRLCASRTGQLLNTNQMGSEVGVKHNTIKSWISVLQASYIVKLLRPWHANIKKRLIKTPKLYFLDTGLACHLLGINKTEHVSSHPLRGALFETMIVSEALKQRFNVGRSDNLSYFRDHKGNEVDLLADYADGFDAIEIKSALTFTPEFFKGLDLFDSIAHKVRSKKVVYGGLQGRKFKGNPIESWQRFSISVD